MLDCIESSYSTRHDVAPLMVARRKNLFLEYLHRVLFKLQDSKANEEREGT